MLTASVFVWLIHGAVMVNSLWKKMMTMMMAMMTMSMTMMVMTIKYNYTDDEDGDDGYDLIPKDLLA